MLNKSKLDQTSDLLGDTYGKLKKIALKKLRRRTAGTPKDHEICLVYDNFLGRQPEPDELLHWKVCGTELDVIKSAILQSFEFENKRVNQQRVLVDIQNFKIFAMMNDTDVGRGIVNSKCHEPHVETVLKAILHSGDVFLDLGANIGYFTLLAASIVRDIGKVISFEPNMQNLQLLYASIIENKFSNIIVYPFAASDTNQIFSLTSFGSNGFIEKAHSAQSNSQFLQSVLVDNVLQNEEKISVIKMDIEGFETLALRGMERIISKHKPVIVTEFNPWHIKHRTQIEPEEYLRQISEYGYDLSIIEPTGCTTLKPSIDSVMDIWRGFDNDKQHLDLLARHSGK